MRSGSWRNVVSSVCLLLAPAAVAHGSDYYVAKDGSDSADGSQGSPWRTIQHAADYSGLQPGDSVYVRGGDYGERPTMKKSGTEGAPISFIAYPGETVKTTGFDLDGVSHNVIDGFKITESSRWICIEVKGGSDHNVLRNLRIHDLYGRYGIMMRHGAGNVIEHCKIWNLDAPPETDNHGIMLDGDRDTVVRYNEIWNCEGDCIQFYHPDELRDHGNTQVLCNHLYVEADWALGCENAIDIKQATQTGLVVIRGNVIHGFRWVDTSVGSTGSSGAAITAHYQYTDNVWIDANYIYDSEQGVRFTKGMGNHHVYVTNNVFRDIRDHDGLGATEAVFAMTGNMSDVIIANNTAIDCERRYDGGGSLRLCPEKQSLRGRRDAQLHERRDRGPKARSSAIPRPGRAKASRAGTARARLLPVGRDLPGATYTENFGLPPGSPMIDRGRGRGHPGERSGHGLSGDYPGRPGRTSGRTSSAGRLLPRRPRSRRERGESGGDRRPGGRRSPSPPPARSPRAAGGSGTTARDSTTSTYTTPATTLADLRARVPLRRDERPRLGDERSRDADGPRGGHRHERNATGRTSPWTRRRGPSPRSSTRCR